MTRVIGIGQTAAGDDGVGIAVVNALRDINLPDYVEIVTLGDPTHLIELLLGVKRVILVDAVIGNREPGSVASLAVEDLADNQHTSITSHGINVVQAIHIARALMPESIATDIQILGIFIDTQEQSTFALSAGATAAIPKAVALLHKIIEL